MLFMVNTIFMVAYFFLFKTTGEVFRYPTINNTKEIIMPSWKLWFLSLLPFSKTANVLQADPTDQQLTTASNGVAPVFPSVEPGLVLPSATLYVHPTMQQLSAVAPQIKLQNSTSLPMVSTKKAKSTIEQNIGSGKRVHMRGKDNYRKNLGSIKGGPIEKHGNLRGTRATRNMENASCSVDDLFNQFMANPITKSCVQSVGGSQCSGSIRSILDAAKAIVNNCGNQINVQNSGDVTCTQEQFGRYYTVTIVDKVGNRQFAIGNLNKANADSLMITVNVLDPTLAPTTVAPTTTQPTTVVPTTAKPTTIEPTTVIPSTVQPTTMVATTAEPSTTEPTTEVTTSTEATTSPEENTTATTTFVESSANSAATSSENNETDEEIQTTDRDMIETEEYLTDEGTEDPTFEPGASRKRMSPGEIAGAVVGSTAGLCLLAAAGACYAATRRKRIKYDGENVEVQDEQNPPESQVPNSDDLPPVIQENLINIGGQESKPVNISKEEVSPDIMSPNRNESIPSISMNNDATQVDASELLHVSLEGREGAVLSASANLENNELRGSDLSQQGGNMVISSPDTSPNGAAMSGENMENTLSSMRTSRSGSAFTTAEELEPDDNDVTKRDQNIDLILNSIPPTVITNTTDNSEDRRPSTVVAPSPDSVENSLPSITRTQENTPDNTVFKKLPISSSVSSNSTSRSSSSTRG